MGQPPHGQQGHGQAPQGYAHAQPAQGYGQGHVYPQGPQGHPQGPQGHAYPQGPQGHPQGPQGHAYPQGPQGHAHGPQGHAHGPQGYAHGPQGHAYPQAPQGYAQGHAYSQGPQGHAYPQGPQGHAYPLAPQGYARGHQGHAYAHHHAGYPAAVRRFDPDRRLRIAGLWLWAIGLIAGAVLNVLFTLLGVIESGGSMLSAMLVGALFAFPPLVLYLFVPMIIDRYDPEPWWCLLMAFLWGALAATGFSILINTGVHIGVSSNFGEPAGELVSASVSAPFAEELFKGLGVFGFFYFLRREFDGIVDGIIYATFCALGFAAVENVLYYARASMQGSDVLAGTFVLRGVFTPWLHPLFTSMTGIGFGLARESSKTWVRAAAPIGGYLLGVALHAVWNFLPTALGRAMGDIFMPWLLLWLCFVASFFGIIVALVIRKGWVIRDHLRDEVALGMLTQDELELVCSPIGRLRCTLGWRGATGRSFIRAGARLALSKWHTARALQGRNRTLSADFIGPLRQEIAQLRHELLARAPR
ncbi:PrsW family glutamic-type intramembrane protease [Sorangium sp. So ce327]|jgi:RsiW-degrading membrane proteinase PrsW (M82 family)|uniref:PrsW family intramembrane metalloprotease n=1 Tax=Sorangium sp. So ce327 TaxID=3133301 RepID=UPI003F6238F8